MGFFKLYLNIVVIFHNIAQFFCIFKQINAVLMCIRDVLQNLTNPKHLNNSVIYFQEAIE